MDVATLIEPATSLWAGFPPATCMPEGCYCEPLHAGLVRQPVNALSSLAFVAVGLGVLPSGSRSRPGREADAVLPAAHFRAAYAATLIAIGLASAVFHSSLVLPAQFADILGIYVFGALLVADAVGRAWPLRGSTLAGGFLVLVVGLATLAVLAPGTGLVGGGLLLFCLTAIERRNLRVARPDGAGRRWAGALALVAGGFALSALDESGVLCQSHSWLQGHPAWHVLCAAAAGVLFGYYCPATTRLRTRTGAGPVVAGPSEAGGGVARPPEAA